MTIETILKSHEGKALEFKENLNSKEKFLATIIAFSNTAGGKIILGIDDKTRYIVGIEDPHLLEERISNLISDSVEPLIVPNIEIIPWRDTHVVLAEIYPSSNRPHYLKKKGIEVSTYVRVGSTNRVADRELIETLKRSVRSKTFDEELCFTANEEDINIDLITELFKPHRKVKESDLYTLDILSKDQNHPMPTNGGVLLFAQDREKYFPDAWIQAGRFQGKDKAYIIDNYEIRDPLPLAIEQGVNFVRKHINVGYTIKELKHEEAWAVPKIAIREAIINAILHTDYSFSGAPIRISIFDDRIEIENPGLLPVGITLDDIKSGVSKIRNRVIARVFRELQLIEKWGSGIQRIIRSCQEAGLPAPSFKEIGNRFRITFYTQKIAEVKLEKIEIDIIDLLKKHDSLSTHTLATSLSLSQKTVRSHLIKLLEKGKVIELARSVNDPQKKYIFAGEDI